MRAWLQHHRLSFVQTLSRLAGSPLATTLNVATIGVVLALPLGAYCVLGTLERISGRTSMDPQLSIFLARDAAKTDVGAVEARLKSAEGVRAVRFVSRDEALAQLGRAAGMDEMIAGLRNNPLPDAFVVTLSSTDAALADRLEQEFRSLAKVDRVLADATWIKRLDAMLRLSRTAVVVLSVLLGLSLVAVTFNTIRLQILTQRDEIELCRLIGATRAYIRRPFFWLGSLLGLLGGLAALAIVLAALAVLDRGWAELALLYGSGLRLRFPDAGEMVSVLVFAAVLGWLGAYLSVSMHLLSTHETRP